MKGIEQMRMIQTVKKMEKEAIKRSKFDFIRLSICGYMEMKVGANDVVKMHSIVMGTGIVSAIIVFIIEGVVL